VGKKNGNPHGRAEAGRSIEEKEEKMGPEAINNHKSWNLQRLHMFTSLLVKCTTELSCTKESVTQIKKTHLLS